MTQVRGELEQVSGHGFYLKTALRSYKVHFSDRLRLNLSDADDGKEAIGTIGEDGSMTNCDGWIVPGTLAIVS